VQLSQASGTKWAIRALSPSLALVVFIAVGFGWALSTEPARAGAAASGPASTGDVFVANSGARTVTGYDTSASGDAAPDYTVGGATTSPLRPSALAFDGSGNLWVANFGNDTVSEYPAGSLGTSGTPVPEVTIGSSGLSPNALAFNASGDLWVANDSDTLTEFTPSQLTSSGSPTPAVTLGSNGSSLVKPDGLAFDSAGNLWVSNEQSQSVSDFTPAQLASSGSPTPTVTISADGLGQFELPHRSVLRPNDRRPLGCR
jgi:sugar lactone lactonase YvrE